MFCRRRTGAYFVEADCENEWLLRTPNKSVPRSCGWAHEILFPTPVFSLPCVFQKSAAKENGNAHTILNYAKE
jgi:hypothetical protein